MKQYGSSTADFKPGDRVEISPHFDLWMRGARFGTVKRLHSERVWVKLDLLPTRSTIAFEPQDLMRR